jgi:DNA-binding CsgD family transcriptional regulator
MTEPLTPREVEVARLVARGLSAKAIGRQMGVSAETVRAHIRNAAARIPGSGPAKHKLLLFVLTTKENRRAG